MAIYKEKRVEGRKAARINTGKQGQLALNKKVISDIKAKDLTTAKKDLRLAGSYARGRGDVALNRTKKTIKENQGLIAGTIGAVALGGLALKRKSIASHIRNIRGKAVRVKGTGLPKPKKVNKRTGVVDVYSETVEKTDFIDKTKQLPNLANRKANTAKVQQRLAYLEEQSPFIKLTKSKKERAREIKRLSKQYPYPFSRFVGLIEFSNFSEMRKMGREDARRGVGKKGQRILTESIKGLAKTTLGTTRLAGSYARGRLDVAFRRIKKGRGKDKQKRRRSR